MRVSFTDKQTNFPSDEQETDKGTVLMFSLFMYIITQTKSLIKLIIQNFFLLDFYFVFWLFVYSSDIFMFLLTVWFF